MATDEARSTPWSIDGLAASGPDPGLRDELMLFGQFVGDWDIEENLYLEDDGTWKSGQGEVHWRWILEGRAVQDVWTERDPTTGRVTSVGTTVRFYSSELKAWYSVWLSPVQGRVRRFIGRRVGDEIVLEGERNPDGSLVRWIFYDITADRFRWRAERRRTSDPDWVVYERMRIRRTARA